MSPVFAMRKAATLKPTAQTGYDGPLGNILQKVSEQLVTSPMDVLRHAIVTMIARMIPPAVPK